MSLKVCFCGYRVKELEMYSSQLVEESRRQNQQLQQTLARMEKHLIAEQQSHATTRWVPSHPADCITKHTHTHPAYVALNKMTL